MKKTFISSVALTLTYAATSLAVASTESIFIANDVNGFVRGYTIAGSDAGNLNTNPVPQAHGIAVDFSNNIYVASASGNYVRRFSPQGVDLGVFASTGIDDPRSMAFDAAGNLYVANAGNNTVRRFSPGGADLGNFITNGLSNPTGMAFDELGNLYVANYFLNQVKKFAPNGTYLGVAISTQNQPVGLLVIPQARGGGFYVATDFSSTVVRYDAAGTFVSTLTSGSLGRLYYLAGDSDGNVYVSRFTGNAIRKFSPTGQDLGDFAVTGLNGPTGIAVTRSSDSLTQGLVAFYPFDGTVSDQSGNGNHGFANNAVLASNRFGVANSAYYFNGVNAQVLVNDNAALRGLQSNYTFTAWVKFDSLPGSDMSILMKSFGAGFQNKWALWKHSGIGLLTHENSKTVLWNYNYPLTTGRWYLVGFSAAGTNATISIDGATVSVKTGNLSLPNTTGATLSIGGAEPGGSQWFHGSLDDIRIYNRALTANEIARLHTTESGRILNIRKAIYLDSEMLQVGANYQVQFSSNLSSWTNLGSTFIATNSNWRSSNYFDVDSWDRLFFRVITLP